MSRYIEKRFDELENERPGKGFVMTVYRRRASSSPLALERSLGRRREALRTISERRAYDVDLSASDVPEGLSEEDLPEEATEAKVSAALPQDTQVARRELAEIESLLEHLRSLQGRDTKRDRFFEALRRITEDGRSVLIFTGYVDTLEYLREALVEFYRGSLGCYSGAGGKRWDGLAWQSVTKDAITRALASGELRALVCTDAASEGLNLQAAGALINYDLPWNPSKVEQRIGRIDRIGQRLPEVRIINLFLHNSVDEKVYQALRSRCGLFEHFVGSMQPVLARARRMLLGQEVLDTARIEAAVSEIEGDPLPGEIYLESRAVATDQKRTVLSRDQVEASLSYLKEEFGFRVRGDGRDRSYIISCPRLSKALFTSSVEVLEHDAAARPLSPLEPRIHELATHLSRTGEHLPLAIGTYQSVAFRRSVVYWVSEGKTEPIESFEDLKGRVDSWNGDYPDPGHWLGAQKRAQQEAEEQIRVLEQEAVCREEDGLKWQVAAARLRLQSELGRYLVCLGEGTEDINGLFHQQMTRDIASAHRLRQALEKLGGYPEWSSGLIQDLENFFSRLTENQRKARLLGKELDAALADSRWMAGTALSR